MKIQFGLYTDKGGRDKNEDSHFAYTTGGNALFVVADGLGGHALGEVASKIAVDTISEDFKRNINDFDGEQAIIKANNRILKMQQRNGYIGSTIAIITVIGKQVSCFHLGDTRIYLMQDDRIVYQSCDHSVSQMAVLAGEISEKEIRSHRDRNKLIGYLGEKNMHKPIRKIFDTDEVDSGLICTDGFWEYVLEDEIIASKSDNPKKWLKKMRMLIKKKADKNSDNNTAIAVLLK